MAKSATEKELDLYRSILERPDKFEKGFGWSTVLGIVFCGLVMLPGSIYLGMMSGGQLGSAASWVTVILFNEIARRALKTLSKQNLVILLHAASVVMAANILFPGGPCARLVWRAYLVTSDAIRDANMRAYFPWWWVPDPDSEAITQRNLLHPEWLVPIALLVFTVIIGLIKRYTLGYFFFRLTSDIENLPFPMASVNAQGAMAMAEADEGTDKGEDPGKMFFNKDRTKQKRPRSERWRLFSFGAVLGIGFGFLQVGVPAITGLFLDKPFFLIPQPFWDTTTLTQDLLPATPTGIAFDLGRILLGMVLPFWAVMGTGFAIFLKTFLNPLLWSMGYLTQWQPGMNTVNTTFANEIDFWMSFAIGASLGLLVVSIYQSIRDVRRKLRTMKEEKARIASSGRDDLFAPPDDVDRGDYPMWIAAVIYAAASLVMVGLCYILLSGAEFMTPAALTAVMVFLFILAFIYNPLISYLNARLLGIAGQRIKIPYTKETFFVLSGARGLDVWMAPIPIENYGHQAQAFRVTELTGTRFWSLVKTDLVAVPVLLLLSFAFWAFIWHSNEVPSASFPYAQTYWEIQSKRTALQWSATHVVSGDEEVDFWQTEFGKAIHPPFIGAGFATTAGIFVAMSALGLPVMFVYGMIRGFSQFPQMLLLEVVGALMGRFYLRKVFGAQQFLRMMPTILAGYFTGVGLIGMATVAMNLIQKAVSAEPF